MLDEILRVVRDSMAEDASISNDNCNTYVTYKSERFVVGNSGLIALVCVIRPPHLHMFGDDSFRSLCLAIYQAVAPDLNPQLRLGHSGAGDPEGRGAVDGLSIEYWLPEGSAIECDALRNVFDKLIEIKRRIKASASNTAS